MRKKTPDFLDEMLAECTKKDPTFPAKVAAAAKKRKAARKLTQAASPSGRGAPGHRRPAGGAASGGCL